MYWAYLVAQTYDAYGNENAPRVHVPQFQQTSTDVIISRVKKKTLRSSGPHVFGLSDEQEIFACFFSVFFFLMVWVLITLSAKPKYAFAQRTYT